MQLTSAGERALVGCTPEEIAPLQEAFAREGITGYLRTRLEQAVAEQGRLRVGSGFAGAMDAFDVARTHARLGQKDRVFEWLEKAYGEHSGRLVQLREEIDFDPVRTDPRFADLLRRVGLPPV